MPDMTPPSADGPMGPPAVPRARSRWAEQELGELLAKAWLEGDAAPAADPPPADPPAASPGGLWEVAPMPSAAEGGVVAMLLSDPSGGTTTAAPPSLPDCGDDVGGTGRERLHQMLDGLPAEPAPRLTPDDVEVETPDPAPPAVWFWGDDDIYPDRVPGSSDGRAGRRRRRSLGRPGTA